MIRLLLLIAIVTIAAAIDLKDRRIPNVVTVLGVSLGLGLGLFDGTVVSSLLGILAALALGFPAFAAGSIGAGDAKLLAAVGAIVGPIVLVSVILYAGAAGLVMALTESYRNGTIWAVALRTQQWTVHLLTLGRRGQRIDLSSPGASSIPYGVAIAVGAIVAWFLPLIPGGGS
jgi:prepilin peptidase CpaA